jgi:hypothetical protein
MSVYSMHKSTLELLYNHIINNYDNDKERIKYIARIGKPSSIFRRAAQLGYNTLAKWFTKYDPGMYHLIMGRNKIREYNVTISFPARFRLAIYSDHDNTINVCHFREVPPRITRCKTTRPIYFRSEEDYVKKMDEILDIVTNPRRRSK